MPTNTHYIDGDNYQLRQVIFANTPKAISQTKDIAKKFKGKSEYDTCKKIFDFLKNDITYKADTGHQKVKLPSALLREKVGDCKSYSLFTGAILSNLGIGWKYVLVSYRNDPTPTHIYVVTDSGIIIDAVWGKFNSEKKPTHKFYHKPIDMRISTITGIGNTPSIGAKTDNPNYAKEPIGAPRAFIWYRDTKGKEPSTAEQIKWRGNQTLLAGARFILIQLFKANAGGISTMLSDLTFGPVGQVKQYPIPAKVSKKINAEIAAKYKQLGLPASEYALKQAYVSKVTVPMNTGGALSLPNNTGANAAAELQKRIDTTFGQGTYKRYNEFLSFKNNLIDNTKKKYAVTITEKSKKKYGEFANKWFNKGGDPWSLLEAIKEGAKKQPRGKDFNYLIRKGAGKGLKIKDAGLVLRALGGVLVGGNTFNLSSQGSFVLGRGINGWIATASANMKPIMELLGMAFTLFGMLKAVGLFGGEGEGEGEETTEDTSFTGNAEIDRLLESGYMYQEDAIAMEAPVPYEDTQVIDGTTLVRPNADWMKKTFGEGGGELLAGFGGIVLPLLIGGGVLMALKSSKRIQGPKRRRK